MNNSADNQNISRNIKIYFWSELFGGISFITPVITFFYLHRGLEYSDLFIMLLIMVITTFLMEVPTGIFGDKFGPKKSFIVGHFLRIASIIILLFAFNPFWFYLSSAIASVGFTFFSGSDQAFIYETLKELKRENEMSRVWGRIHSATIIPSAVTILVGAYLAQNLSESQFLLLIILGLLFNSVKFVLLLFLVPPKSFHLQRGEHSFSLLMKGIGNITSQKNLMLLFINECMVMIPTYVIISNENLIQPYFISSGIPVLFIGLIYSVDAVLSSFVLNMINQVEKYFSRKSITLLTGIAIGLPFLITAFSEPSVMLALFLFFSVKIFFWLRYPVFQQIKNDYIPSKSRATTLSLLSMVDSMFDMLILGTLYFFSLGEPEVRDIFMICGLIIFAGLLFPVRINNNKNGELNYNDNQ